MLYIRSISVILIIFLPLIIAAEEDTPMSIGQNFHHQTGFGDSGVKGTDIKFGKEIPLYKTYPGVPRFKLPVPTDNNMTVEKAIADRHSVRTFTDQPLTLAHISRLLQSADGISHTWGGYQMRSAPSGGALYPVDLYLVIHAVTDLKSGLYHYQVSDSSLELIKEGDFRDQLYKAAFEQGVVNNGQVSIVMTARFDRSTKKYADRGYRYTYMESGAICQNVYLQATSLGLGTTAVGAFNDDAVNALLDIDGVSEAALLIMPIGHPK